jgi:peptidoglycan/xylan/chitin deacetylase (PgdA/CDA1 family)
MNKLLILNYHAILPNDAENDGDVYKIKFSQFLEQLNCIEKFNIPIVSASAWKTNIHPFEKFSIALTFDDGLASHVDLVLPELLKRNIPATFFPIVSKIGQEGYLTWSQLDLMQKNGFEIGSHSFSHKGLISFSKRDLRQEITHSKEILQEKLGQSITQFSLPYGVYSRSSLNLLSVDYNIVLSTKSKINLPNAGLLLHRFNIKNDLNLIQFEGLLNQKYLVLQKKKLASIFALTFNRIKGLFDSILSKKTN